MRRIRAGYHGAAKTRRPRGLVVPGNITLLHLPPSSPELNPIEVVWQDLRQNKLANRVLRDYRQIVDACCDAWNVFAKDPASSLPSPRATGHRSKSKRWYDASAPRATGLRHPRRADANRLGFQKFINFILCYYICE